MNLHFTFKFDIMITSICIIQKSEDAMPQDYMQVSLKLVSLLGSMRLRQVADAAGVFTYFGLLRAKEKETLSKEITKYNLIFIEHDEDEQSSDYLSFIL